MGKQSEVITIEKLKLLIDEKSLKGESRTSNALGLRGADSDRGKYRSQLFLLLLYFLEPILPGDGKKSDGSIASVVYLICLTTAGVVLNITSWLQGDPKIDGITTDHIDGFLITCICPALLWIAFIFCKQNNRKTVDFITPLPHSHRPLMAGAYVFGAGCSVMDMLHISYHLHCSKNLSGLIFSVFKSVFILAQILFLRKFANATLHKSQYIRLVLFHILGTNICIWIRALFSHFRLFIRPDAGTGLDRRIDVSEWCGDKDVPMSKIWSATEPYLYPFTMEYTLVAGGILYTMWSGTRDLDPDPQDIYIYDEMNDNGNDHDVRHKHGATSKDGDKLPHDDSGGFYDPQVTHGSLTRSQSHLSLYSHTSAQSVCRACQESHENMETYRPSSDPGLLFGILLSTLLLLSIALMHIDKDSHHGLRFYYLYQIVFYSIIIICLWLVLKALLAQKSSWYPYNSDDTLLIVSFTGMFVYCGISFAAGVVEARHMGDICTYSMAKSILVLVESILQVTCITKALRLRPATKGFQADIVRQGALFLMTTNMALWAQDSFFELRNTATTPVQVKLFGEVTWRTITILDYPLCVFFRFHSGACLFELWCTFKKA